MTEAQNKAAEIETRVLRKSSEAYENAASAVIRRHKETLRTVREMEKRGEYDLAQARIKSSGLVEDLALALAGAGAESASLILAALAEIREVMAGEHDGQAP